MNLSRRIWAVVTAVTVMVIGMATTMTRDARAGIQVFYFTSTAPNAPCQAAAPAPSFRNRYLYAFGGCPEHSVFQKFRYAFGQQTNCAPDNAAQTFSRDCAVNDPLTQSVFDHITMSGGAQTSGFPEVYAICVGDVIGGGPSHLGTSAVDDTASCSVGTPSLPMKLSAVRSGDTITLSTFTGQLRVNTGRVRTHHVRASYIVAVYKDSTDAYSASPQERGPALFWGRVNLSRSPGGAKTLTMDGDFGGSDFTSPTDPDAFTSLANPGTINKVVSLAGATNPVVMLLSDPRDGIGAVPGTSPVGLLALTAAMAGAGLWVMVRRRRLA